MLALQLVFQLRASTVSEEHSRRLAELKVNAMRRLDDTVYLASTTNVPLTAGRELRRLGTLNSMTFCNVPASGPLKRWKMSPTCSGESGRRLRPASGRCNRTACVF